MRKDERIVRLSHATGLTLSQVEQLIREYHKLQEKELFEEGAAKVGKLGKLKLRKVKPRVYKTPGAGFVSSRRSHKVSFSASTHLGKLLDDYE